jgi:hypothetical protein
MQSIAGERKGGNGESGTAGRAAFRPEARKPPLTLAADPSTVAPVLAAHGMPRRTGLKQGAT